MVLTAIDEPEASTQIWKLCKEKRIAANIADVPPECDFYFGSVHRDGPLQIMVSTNGNGPKMANIVRRRIASSLPPNIGDAIAKVGMLRKKLRVLVPENDEGPKRMQWYGAIITHPQGYTIVTNSHLGCPKSVCHGLWKICVRWMRRTWNSYYNTMLPIRSLIFPR